MSRHPHTRAAFPAGPVLSVMLVGILVLSALLYYRAVKIQRFLEPALALAIPRSEFSHQMMDAMVREFGSSTIGGVNFRTMSIQLAGPLIFSPAGAIDARGHAVLKKTALAFRSVLLDERARPDIGYVLLIVRYPGGLSEGAARAARFASQGKAWNILDTMYAEEPRLGSDFGHLFIAVAAPGGPRPGQAEEIEFRIVPSERMHIEFLQKLEKYAQ